MGWKQGQAKDFLLLNLGVLLNVVGIYFFKFPNHFSTGGVSGLSIVLGHYTSAVSPATFVTGINVLLLIVGMVMDTSPAILILTPILIHITNSLGIDPIQFGIIMVVNLAIGFVTPPIGINLFVASSLTDVPVMQIAKKAMPLIVFFLSALLAITFIPQISLLLVS